MENKRPVESAREWLLLIFVIVSILGLFGRSGYLIIRILTLDAFPEADVLASGILGAVSTGFCALLFLPVLVSTIRHMQGRALAPARIPALKAWHVVVLIGIWFFSVLLGGILAALFDFGWAPAIPFFVAAIVVPALGLVWVAQNGLPTASWRRLWAALGLGMTGSTIFSMLAEYALMALAGLVATLIASGNPEWQAAIDLVKNQLEQSTDVQTLLVPLASYLTKPLVFLILLLFAAGIGPLIEEASKSAAVWLVGRRMRSPAEGFYLGALGGAGFALLEGFLAASGASSMLGVGLAGRTASTLMHVSASAILGWGVASALLEKKYKRLILTYLASVALHGLWNGSALLSVYGALRTTAAGLETPDLVSSAAMLVGVGTLLTVLVSILLVLPLANHFLRRNHTGGTSDIMPPSTP